MDAEQASRNRPRLVLMFCALPVLLGFTGTVTAWPSGQPAWHWLGAWLIWCGVLLSYVVSVGGLLWGVKAVDRRRIVDELVVAHRHTAAASGFGVPVVGLATWIVVTALGVAIPPALMIPLLTPGILTVGVVWSILELRSDA